MSIDLVTLADKGDDDKGGSLIPGAKPTPIPGMSGPVGELMGYGLWLLLLAGVAGLGVGIYKLAVSDKSRHGGGSEPFKWMGGGGAAILLSGSLLSIVNGVVGG
ncbi:hypothetical protein [Streptomyces hygroscopicus]|uniref:hypothetical protein n=1 Tax=Streptomyces hygroscopicus TaxID=1912 RepID=UPI001F20C737|nr:hypothetical protein [Streptomyces hygroscopicus]